MMQYKTGDTVDTSALPLIIRVFGKSVGQDFWIPLRNLNGETSIAVPIDPANDAQLGSATASFTTPDNNAHSWDCDGYERFIIGVEHKYQPASGGSPNDAILWAKIV